MPVRHRRCRRAGRQAWRFLSRRYWLRSPPSELPPWLKHRPSKLLMSDLRMSDLSVAEWPAQPEPRLARAWPVLRLWLRPPSFFARRLRWVFRLWTTRFRQMWSRGLAGFPQAAWGLAVRQALRSLPAAFPQVSMLQPVRCRRIRRQAGGDRRARPSPSRPRSPSLLRVVRRAASQAWAVSCPDAGRRGLPAPRARMNCWQRTHGPRAAKPPRPARK